MSTKVTASTMSSSYTTTTRSSMTTRYEKQASQTDRLDYITFQADTAMRNLKIIANDQQVSDATIQDKIKIVQRTAIAAMLENTLTQQKTKNSVYIPTVEKEEMSS